MTTEQPMRQRPEAGPLPPAALAAEDLCEIFHALSNPARLAIMRWLRDPGSFPPQDRPAEEVGVCLKHIQARAGVSQSTASQYSATTHFSAGSASTWPANCERPPLLTAPQGGRTGGGAPARRQRRRGSREARTDRAPPCRRSCTRSTRPS